MASLGHVRGQRDIVARIQRREHFLERAHAAFAEETAAMMTGTANGCDTEPFGSDGIDLAVAMARDQHLGAILSPPDERHQEMLSMPHRDDDRGVALKLFVDAVWLDREQCGLPYQPEIFGRHDSSGLLEPARADDALHP